MGVCGEERLAGPQFTLTGNGHTRSLPAAPTRMSHMAQALAARATGGQRAASFCTI